MKYEVSVLLLRRFSVSNDDFILYFNVPYQHPQVLLNMWLFLKILDLEEGEE